MINNATGVTTLEKAHMHVIRTAGNIAAHSWPSIKQAQPAVCKECFWEAWVAVKGLSDFKQFLRNYVNNTFQASAPTDLVTKFQKAVANQTAATPAV